MRLTQIDLNLFTVFEAIFKEGNLTRAAEQLNITQPAVSNALVRLRETLNDPLFVRAGRTMNPTPFARDIAPKVQQALSLLLEAADTGLAFSAFSSTKTFRIGLNDVSSPYFLPLLLARVQEQAPQVRIESPQLRRADIKTELSTGKVDFAMDIQLPSSLKIKRVPLHEDSYVCVMRKSHPLAKGKLTHEKFFSHPHITVSNRRTGLTYIEGEVAALGEKITPILRTPNYTAAFNSIQFIDALLAVPRTLAEHHDLVIKELPFETTPLKSYLYWHSSTDNDPSFIWMRNLILSSISKSN